MARGPQRGAASPQNIARAVSRNVNTPVMTPDRFALDHQAEGIPLLDTAERGRDGFHGCRWPVNAAEVGEQHLFCNEPSEIGRPYCFHHCQRAGAGYWLVRAA